MAIEITAAGIEVENVSPALSPKYTFAAVNTSVINDADDETAYREFFAHVCCDVCRSLEAERIV